MADGDKKRRRGSSANVSNGFKSLGLSDEVYKGIVRMGFKNPTPVQRKALPVILTGNDTVVMARTGSGKTAAFCIPLIEKLLSTAKGQNGNHVRGIILSPTRELSLQTLKVFTKLGSGTDLRAIGIHGGEGMEKQFNLLASKPDVIIATPGRLSHHLSEIPDFQLSGCTMCILDEADRLLEMGFAMQIRQIARTLPESCQKVMLSATMPKMLVEFTKSGFANDPSVVRLDQEAAVSAELRIAFITCRSLDKDAALLHILGLIKEDREINADVRTGLTLIFAATRHHVEYIASLLEASGFSTTLIYGSLDQEARKANLAAFRSGQKPVLVVTDVAARGIDVPLIDHVIHYHFPASPKLFVHRSGRAARAGRIGFSFSLVEPDELPFMVDLHLFLGRKPASGIIEMENGNKQELHYTLKDMTPEMVHYGCLPESVLTQEVENIQRIMNSELSGSKDSETLRSLSRVCTNAMKQYRRTRTEASREGIRRAKAILEGERLETGERVKGTSIMTHPLLKGMELRQLEKQRESGSAAGINDSESLQKRAEFLRAMSTFRPKETVFEAFATGGAKEVGVVSHLDKGRTSNSKKHTTSAALSAMKDMRRQMRMARDKGATLVVAGSEKVDSAENSEADENENDDGCFSLQPDSSYQPKKRLSKAKRRRLKRNPELVLESKDDSTVQNEKKSKADVNFRDPTFYIDNDFTSNSEEAYRSRQIEAAMQPSASNSLRGSQGRAFRIEEAMLDLVGDENEEMIKKQRLMRWDKSKRKYVQTTVGSELSGESKSKKTRLESGRLVKNEKLKLGELYEKWQKKSNRSIGRSGVFDDGDGPVQGYSKGKNKTKQADRSAGSRSASAIKKEREHKKDMQIKNMKKADRRAHLQKKGSFKRNDKRGK